MRNRLKPLPQLVLTDLQPSFYDVVSVSTDQMIAKFYAFLQDWVNDYNGFIMDKVVNLINDSAFVIADISAMPEKITEKGIEDGVRGGVYWEAGYAAGQKKQVVLTCIDDKEAIKRIHFDLQQYNQIRWKIVDGKIMTSDGFDFADTLAQRIIATVGRGR